MIFFNFLAVSLVGLVLSSSHLLLYTNISMETMPIMAQTNSMRALLLLLLLFFFFFYLHNVDTPWKTDLQRLIYFSKSLPLNSFKIVIVSIILIHLNLIFKKVYKLQIQVFVLIKIIYI